MTTQANENIPVVDVDQAFPGMVDASRPQPTVGSGDVTGTIDAALRTALGWRPRAGDPKAFLDALGASFRIRQVEGHTVADYVPRGYAVQADLGAVTGGQASLYRRAQIARTEMLRILEGLTPLRMDADQQDMDAYRSMVRNAVQRLVDEIGAAGGPRVQMVDQYLRGLTGQQPPAGPVIADTVGGQLGGLRDRFGLIDANVNTIEEEGVRTSFWTLVDLVVDLQGAWNTQRLAFTGATGQGFLGTDLILISRLMEAATDQVDEVEAVLDSVLIPVSERRTIMLDRSTSLTLDGLLTWLRSFLGNEGRRAAQDSGRDGIVSFVAPTAVQLLQTFRLTLADRLSAIGQPGPVQFLPASCCAPLPAGLVAARSRIAVASLCRLLTDLAQTAQRIGRFPRAVLLNVTIRNVATRANTVEVQFRGLNLRPVHIPAFVVGEMPDPSIDCPVVDYGTDGLLLALEGSSTGDDETVSAFFEKDAVQVLMDRILPGVDLAAGVTVPAEDLATALIDGELGTVVYAPDPRTYPDLQRLSNPLSPQHPQAWDAVPANEQIKRPVTAPVGGARAGLEPDPPVQVPDMGPAGRWGCGCGGHPPCDCRCQDERQHGDDGGAAAAGEAAEEGADVPARVVQAGRWNKLLDTRDEEPGQVAGQGQRHGRAGAKDDGCPAGCDGVKHPCGGCGRVYLCGCFDLCRDCESGGRMGPQVAVIIGQLIVLMDQHRDAQHQVARSRMEFGRADGVYALLAERLDNARGAAIARQQPAVEDARLRRDEAEAEMQRHEGWAQELQERVEALHTQLTETVVPPVADDDSHEQKGQ